MSRRTAAVVLALMLNQAPLRAQDTVLTVNVPSADVHKGPSTVTPVIGHASRGSVLPISRNLGSWVKVAWPDGPDGIGYVHVTMGHVGPANADPPAAPRSRRASSAPAPAATTIPPRTRTPVDEPVAVRSQSNGTPVSHIFGVGGLVGPMSTFGATARAWRHNHLGIQFGVARDAMTSDVAAGRVTSMQLEPAVMYSLFDHVSDYVWIRPYVGSAVSFRHQTWSGAANAMEPASDNGLGFRVFGGSELTYASLLRFALSVELGYRRFPAPFPGFEAGPLSATIAGHWYIK